MTEFELLELQSAYGAQFAATVMNFISILSGFLLANHFLGSKINNAQFTIMLLMYTIVMLVTGSGMYVQILDFDSTEHVLAAIDRSWPSNQVTGGLNIVVPITLLVTYIGSLLFAFTARKHQTPGRQ
jgi:hypothetical protein